MKKILNKISIVIVCYAFLLMLVVRCTLLDFYTREPRAKMFLWNSSEDKLQEAREAEGVGEEVEAKLDEVSMELTTVMSALQFQDITSQQIEATHAVLAELGGIATKSWWMQMRDER